MTRPLYISGQDAEGNDNDRAANNYFEGTEEFKYLGTPVGNQNIARE
jgi:hypothetical protein